jgi:1-deoxy-D-xylulose-5-phosphate reductoisomerase
MSVSTEVGSHRSHETDAPIGVAILGSTGSIGTQALDVIRAHPGKFEIISLAAGANGKLLQEQVAEFRPRLVVAHPDALAAQEHATAIDFATGEAGLVEAATHPQVDVVLVATSGHAAITPTIRAIEAGKTIALANKESIVCAGELIIPLARAVGVEIRPVDSEHSAIWQCLTSTSTSSIARLVLTASGGPFREASIKELENVSIAQALDHPTWQMGGKITIDSATMMNKGLELIEAHWLFGVPYEDIDVLVHPESIIHSLVEFDDGSQLAQLSLPDMRLPIQYALTYPEHWPGPMERLDLAKVANLSFFAVDHQRFPAVSLARQAGQQGQSYPTVLSSADEIAVAAFLEGALRFHDIVAIVEETLEKHDPVPISSTEHVAEADLWARAMARECVKRRRLRA